MAVAPVPQHNNQNNCALPNPKDEFKQRLLVNGNQERWQKGISISTDIAAFGSVLVETGMMMANAPKGAKIATGAACIGLNAVALGRRIKERHDAEKNMHLISAVNQVLKTVHDDYALESEFYSAVLHAATKGVAGGMDKLPFERAALFKIVEAMYKGERVQLIKGVAIVNGKPDIEGFEILVNHETLMQGAFLPRIVADKRTIFVENTGVKSCPFTFPAFEKFFGEMPRSIVGVPLVHQNEVILIFTLDNHLKKAKIGKAVRDAAEAIAQDLAAAIVEMKKKNKDGLTDSKRREYLDLALDHAIEQKRRYGTPFSVMMVDVDNLKEINDGQGHQKGDEALISVVRTMREHLRGSDMIIRYGGDEFFIIMPMAQGEFAEKIAGRIRESVWHDANVTVSIGVVPDPGNRTREPLIADVDKIMYAAKQIRNSVVVEGAK